MVKISVGKMSDVYPGKMIGSQIDGEKILVANVDGKFYAMRSTCKHRGGPLLEGKLEGKVVTCPWHGSKWDVTTGDHPGRMRSLPGEPVYKVTVEGDEIFVEIKDV